MEVDLLIHFYYVDYCLLHIFVGENCYLLAHLDILGTCTEILDILALDILDLDILGLAWEGNTLQPQPPITLINQVKDTFGGLFFLHSKAVASFPGLPHLSSSVCIQYNTRKRKSAKNGEGLVSFIT